MESYNPYRFGNIYKLPNGKVQYRISGYYPGEDKVLLRFGVLPVKAKISELQGVLVDEFLLHQLGFSRDRSDEKFWKKDHVIVYLIEKGKFRLAFETEIYDRVFHYLHQLQNLYYSHTGTEIN